MKKISFDNFYNRYVILVLLFGMLVTLAVTYRVQDSNKERIADAVFQSSNYVMEEVLSRIQIYQYGLRGARAVVLTAGEQGVSKDTFHQYNLTRDLETEFPGAMGFGFIRRVPKENTDQFIQSARQHGWPDFQIKELSSNFGDRYIIQFVEPVERNLPAIGLDIASEKNRREAASSALYSGGVRMTGPITLVQASGKAQQSVLILMPIYRGGKVPSTLEERKEKGFGWSYAPLIIEDVLKDLQIDLEKVHYELFDITDVDNKVRFYDSGDLKDDRHKVFQSQSIYGRQWESCFSVSSAFIADLHLPNPFSVLVIGGFISALVALLVAMVRANVAHKSRIAAIVESSADGIISKSLSNEIVSWNKGAEQIFGYTQEEVMGESSLELLVPTDLQYEDKLILSSVIESKESFLVETRRKTKSGSDVPVALTVSPIFDSNHIVVGVSNSVRDISERKKAEAKIRDLNTNLESQVKARTLEIQEINLLLNDVLNASSEISIIATDKKGVINLFNSGAQRMLGYSAEEAVNKMTPLDFHDHNEIEQAQKAILETSGTYVSDLMDVLIFKAFHDDYDRNEWTYIDKFGNRKPVSLVITPMKNADNQIVGFLGMAMDITEQKESQLALVSARDQLLVATEAARLGVWRWDVELGVLEWNDIMFDIYQLPHPKNDETSVVFDTWLEKVHPEDRAWTSTFLQEILATEGTYSIDFRIVLPDGSVRYIKSDAYVDKTNNGNTINVIGVNQDITSERELETRLRNAKNEADAASAAKSSFLANMSHEIRTPMNAILGMLQLVKRTSLTHQQEDYISKAHISAKSLLGLINDVLDFSKVDAGKLELESVPFDVENLLYELSTVLSGGALKDNVELIFDIDKDIPLSLVGDKLRLLQVLINLLSNAIKFTLEGCVILEIRHVSASKGMSRLTVSVKDTGIGISDDKIESIFEVFSQAESSTTRRFGGSGLGLVICRHFVDLMGGTLNVESRLGEGSRFYFTIDLPIANSTDNTTSLIQKSAPVHILIVDNNQTSQRILTRMANNLGWSHEQADTIEAVISKVNGAIRNDNVFNIVLLDVKTSDFTGRDSLLKMREEFDSHSSHPKVILLANTPNEKLERSLAFAADYLLKPTTQSQLSETILKALSGSNTAKDGQAINQSAKTTVNLDGVKLLLVEDNAFNRQVATELLAAEGAIVTVAEGGREGVETVFEQNADFFDLVLMDMQMPGVDGLDATKQIRKNPQFSSLPIVAMTANVSESDRRACLDSGMNDHLGKPLDVDLMIACILRYVDKKPPLNVSVDAETVIKTEEDASKEYEDIESVLNRFGGSADLFKSVVESFVIESNDLLEKIQQGVKERDSVRTREYIHSLKGSALTMGLLHLSSQLSHFEQVLKATEDKDELEVCFSSIQVSDLRSQLHQVLDTIVSEVNGFT